MSVAYCHCAQKDDTLRFCANYSKANAVAGRKIYLILQIDDRNDSLITANVFLVLDAYSENWHIELDKNHMNKTAFVPNNGMYRYTHMLFGLENVFAIFQQAMDIILVPVKCQHALVCTEDIVIFFKTSEERFNHIEFVLQLPIKAGITLKLKKCFSFFDAIDYLRQVIAPSRLHISTKTIDAYAI